ncbi:MAG: glutathione S-transferase family protein [Hyphomicrobiaceae bacterium]|nr:glutathione S-transferase family protein [Hyphomicrobiaceae bacterium]
MPDNAYRLVLGDKNFSSWSLRPWLLMRMFDIPFEEINVDIYNPGARKRVLEHSPSGKVPALKTGDLTIWDTLAITEYLAETHPDYAIWPEDRKTRATARAVTAEMHSGFENLRGEMPMNILGSKPVDEVSVGVGRDTTRIIEIWRMCRTTYGGDGPFLFGTFSAADAMYAPVTTRFRTYGVRLTDFGDDGTAETYCRAILSLEPIAEWSESGRKQMKERGIAY